MQKVYRLKNVEDIIGYDEYIKDFQEQAADYCKSDAESMVQSVLAEYDTDTEYGVFLDGEQTKRGHSIEFEFHVSVAYGKQQPRVTYYGFV
jgi:hypothetical protein